MYSLTISLSAFLLFLVQPLISKMLLPSFGGGASTWITSLVFFQAMLLAGYGITHFLVRRLGLRRHMFVTVALLVFSLAWLPVGPDARLVSDIPVIYLFLLLTFSVGLPCFTLATTSPTLQYWIANDDRTADKSPYIQYGVSNVGSLAGLLIYPFVLERFMTSDTQAWLWSSLYGLYVLMMAATIGLFVKHNRLHVPNEPGESLHLTRNLRVRWILQAMVPSALLVVITHYLTLDVVNFPLLWVAPLCLYLLTFIICFMFPRVSTPGDLRTSLGTVSVLLLLIASYPEAGAGWELKIAAALFCMFCVAMIFHGDLEREKPHKQNLTDFYLQMAAGGTLGGIAGAVLAPLVFDSTFEFYVVLVVSLYYMIVTRFRLDARLRWLFRGGVAVSLGISWLVHERGLFSETIYQTRTFYSTYAVRQSEQSDYPTRRLVAGTHVHGRQYFEGPLAHEPVGYYHRRTGVADVFALLKPERTAVVGLGIGSVVEYGDETDRFDIFELDQVVIEIANTYFTVLPESASQLNYYVGDGRVNLRRMPRGTYDLVVMDSFTSGSIPTHLVTLEAIEEFFARMKEGGAIVYHISNRHVDLLPVLNGIAQELDVGILYHETGGAADIGGYPATWVALTKNDDLLEAIGRRSGWEAPPDCRLVWTDQFSNIWSILR